MKKLIVLLLASCALVVSQGFSKVATGDAITDFIDGGKIPLSRLDGTYSVTQHGSLFFCVSDTSPFPPAQCGSAGSIGFPLTLLDVGSVTGANGVSCATLTETSADLPVDVSPPFVEVFHSVSILKNYDPETGTGDISFTAYSGGKCHGATFDSTGATVVSTGTEHFAASNRGKQIDYVITSLTNAAHSIGDFSLSGTALRH